MSQLVALEIDTEAEIQKIIQKLDNLQDQIGSPKILKNALNSTARKVRRQLVQDVPKEYSLKDKKALRDENRGGPKVLTATAADLTATVRSRGGMQDIMAFMTKPNTRTGAAAAKVLNASGMKPLEMGDLKAFVTTFASGHTAIVQRRGSSRLPVKKLLSPAVPHLLGNEKVRERAEAMAYETLVAEIDKRIAKITG